MYLRFFFFSTSNKRAVVQFQEKLLGGYLNFRFTDKMSKSQTPKVKNIERQNTEWDKTSNGKKAEWDKRSNGKNAEWDKTSNSKKRRMEKAERDKTSNGKK
jgi:hypothetical protein